MSIVEPNLFAGYRWLNKGLGTGQRGILVAYIQSCFRVEKRARRERAASFPYYARFRVSIASSSHESEYQGRA